MGPRFQRTNDQVVRTSCVSSERTTKSFERVGVSSERATKSFERVGVFSERAAKSFERVDLFTERVTEAFWTGANFFRTAYKRVVNGIPCKIESR